MAFVDAVATHPERAIATAYKCHGDAVFGFAFRLLTDRDLAAEITQEVFLRLWRDPARFDAARGSLRSYLLAQCHSRSLDLVRAESSRRRREERQAVLDLTVVHDVASEVCEAAMKVRVVAALKTLPEGQREAICCAYFGEKTYGEVARLLNTPEGTVKSRIRFGLRRLATELRDLR